jgi:hypothetical protein
MENRIETYFIPTNNLSGVDIKADQITGSHQTEVLPKRVHPDVLWEFGITYGNMPAHSLGEAFAGEIAEDGGSVDKDVAAVLLVG